MKYNIDKVDFSQVSDLEIGKNILDSLTNISELDYVKQISVSRDIHYCNDIPVGTLVKSTRFNAKWIGSDIGCGVSITKLPKGTIDKLNIDYLQNELNNYNVDNFGLGTIGGGNHFVEFGYDDEQNEYVTIHTGSRTHGGMVAEIISNFDIDDNIKFNLYNKSLNFATKNHQCLFNKIYRHNNKKVIVHHHNYIEKDDNYIYHMKGSIKSNLNVLYPIPANMKDGVFLITSIENEFHLPHGSGRLLRRRDALSTLTQQDIDNQTSHLKNKPLYKNRDELPSTYKNIDLVLKPLMELRKIKIIKIIKPIINIKG